MAVERVKAQAPRPKFEVFTKRAKPMTDASVTIQKSGGLGFNHAAFIALGEPKAVELMFDQEQRIVGVRSVSPAEDHAYLVKSPAEKRDKGFILSGRAFTAFYDIRTDEARRRRAYMVDDILCVDLKEPGVVVTSNRNGHRMKQT